MKFLTENSDDATLQELGRRIARVRLNRNLTQDLLAHEAGVSKRTIHRLEHGESIHLSNLVRILRVLNQLENLEMLVPQPEISPLQQLKRRGKARQRASSPVDSTKTVEPNPWTWGNKE